MESVFHHENIVLFAKYLVNDRNQAGMVSIVLGDLSDKKI
jgi:hypothetical protein